MASLNFPPTTPGVTGPEYTLNGIVYYWDGEKWTANNEDGFTEVFVNVDGDNMTGDLTLGTDKITLDADLGEADFAGYVQINSSPTTTNPGLIVSCQQNTPDLGGWIRLADETTGVARSQWGYNLGVNDVTLDLVGSGTGLRIRNSNANLDSAADLITVDANGDTSFVNDVAVGKKLTDPTDTVRGIRIKEAGSFAYIISNDVQSGGGVSTVYQHLLNGDQTLSLNGNGSATFASDVQSGNVTSQGRFTVYSPNASSTEDALNVFRGSTALSSRTVNITYDGKATFNNETTVPYLYVRPALMDTSSGLPGDWSSFRGFDFNGVESSVIYADGSATFAGLVDASFFKSTEGKFIRTNFAGLAVSSQPVNGSAGTLCIIPTNESGVVEANKVALGADSYPWFAIKATSTKTGSLILETELDNPANYVTTADSEGNATRVYNGPTLDVKERLTKADTALQTLKSAAAAAVDFAELKAAIATALVDI